MLPAGPISLFRGSVPNGQTRFEKVSTANQALESCIWTK
jgi:hypothetical protein